MAGCNDQLLHRQHFVVQFNCIHYAMRMANCGHRLAQAEFAASRRLQGRRQLLAKAVAVADFFIRGIDGADKGRLCQCRVQTGAVGV